MVWWFFDVSALCDILSYSNFIHAISGGLGGAFALTVFYPFETARTRLQVSASDRKKCYSVGVIKEVFKNEGFAGLYRGLFAILISYFTTNFFYFYTFHGFKAVLCHGGYRSNMIADFFGGILAGCVAVLCTNPLWVVSTRLKLQDVKYDAKDLKTLKMPKYRGIIDCLHQTATQEGVMQLWSGTQFSLLLVSNPAVQYMVYHTLKRNLQQYWGVQYLGGLWYFLIGAVAKIVATLFTYPLQIIQMRLRVGYGSSRDLASNATLSGILRNGGLRGLYRGLEAKLTQTVLTAALLLASYEALAWLGFSVIGS